ncbi:MAG: HyaD/HybD family hydrogenase maturation endopeptidase [Deltaproteobacteria bacterium]|nr:HyaD/HybD family hydrogenase maturation endopeptidase [Deltaproteobacteria bacterium]
MKENKKVVILGIGNLLLKDEGVGIQLIQLLEQETLPPGVELVDGGTSTLDILPLLQEADKIIVIDAMKAGGEPGSIYRCRPSDLIPSEDAPMSLHHIDFLQALKMNKMLGDDLEPRTVIFGVEPQEIEWEIGLTAPVAAKIPVLKKLVLEEVGKM